ncbi:MAG: DedA family protein [archaeon]|jgi:membrane-associated protein
MVDIIDLVIHLDKYLGVLIATFGPWSYLVLFLVIFCETGLVFLPFLPGDSLLFLAGTFASSGALNVLELFVILSFAAILGDSVNYAFGKFVGEKVFLKKGLLKKEYLDKAKEFYEKHGGKAIILARFIPIIRSIAPFVAGVGKMDYPRFLGFNAIGGILWVGIFVFSGYFFGSIPIIQENLTLFLFLVIVVSLSPVFFEVIKYKLKRC